MNQVNSIRCPYCKKLLNHAGTMQSAHRIAQGTAKNKSKRNNYKMVKKWVMRKYNIWLNTTQIDAIINHPWNKIITCSLECNGKANMGFKPVQAEKLLEEIFIDLVKHNSRFKKYMEVVLNV